VLRGIKKLKKKKRFFLKKGAALPVSVVTGRREHH